VCPRPQRGSASGCAHLPAHGASARLTRGGVFIAGQFTGNKVDWLSTAQRAIAACHGPDSRLADALNDRPHCLCIRIDVRDRVSSKITEFYEVQLQNAAVAQPVYVHCTQLD